MTHLTRLQPRRAAGGRGNRLARRPAGVVDAVDAKIPVLLISGVRTGADVVKALVLGAGAVCIDRPYVYGLALAGQAGVSAVISDLAADSELTEAIARQATTIVDTMDDEGWHCGLHRGVEVPGLFSGLAGIGYGLLRLLHPMRVPSVLAQQPPLFD